MSLFFESGHPARKYPIKKRLFVCSVTQKNHPSSLQKYSYKHDHAIVFREFPPSPSHAIVKEHEKEKHATVSQGGELLGPIVTALPLAGFRRGASGCFRHLSALVAASQEIFGSLFGSVASGIINAAATAAAAETAKGYDV